MGQVQQGFRCPFNVKHGTAIERAVDVFALPERRIHRTKGEGAHPYAKGAFFDGKASAEGKESCLANAISAPVGECLVGCMAVDIDDLPTASLPEAR